jgi:hypothetical protein
MAALLGVLPCLGGVAELGDQDEAAGERPAFQ